MKLLFILFMISSVFAGVPFIKEVTYYDGLGRKFRQETVSAWPNCQEVKRARKIYLDQTNELREIAVWRKDGKVEGANGTNNPKLKAEVDAIFMLATTTENPCKKKEAVKAEASELEHIEVPASTPVEDEPALTPEMRKKLN